MTNDEQTPEEKRAEKRDKRVAYYAASAEAWFGTHMERDRTLLALSAGGLALLAHFLTDDGRTTSCLQLILYIFGVLGFGAAAVALLWVFSRNAKALEKLIQQGQAGRDPCLVILDGVAAWGFAVGALMTIVLAFTYATTGGDMAKQREREQTRTAERRQIERIVPDERDPRVIRRSLVDVDQINPEKAVDHDRPKGESGRPPPAEGDSSDAGGAAESDS